MFGLLTKRISSAIRVLVLDDDPEITNILTTLLRSKQIRTISTSIELEPLIKDFDPHVMILDYNLKDGIILDVLPSVNKYAKKSIPLIYTGMDLADQQKTFLYNQGVMGIITKPCSLSTIEALIENYYEISMKYRS